MSAMKLSRLKALAITHATIGALEAAINKLASGQAMLAADTGTATTLPANWSATRDFLKIEYFVAPGPIYTALIFYADA